MTHEYHELSGLDYPRQIVRWDGERYRLFSGQEIYPKHEPNITIGPRIYLSNEGNEAITAERIKTFPHRETEDGEIVIEVDSRQDIVFDSGMISLWINDDFLDLKTITTRRQLISLLGALGWQGEKK